MAKCEQGYLCEVCGEEVEDLTQSDLYLRYVTGEVPARVLMTARERHLRCNPTLAQFIVDPTFEPVVVEGPFDKRQLDPADVARRDDLVTRGYRRLRELRELRLPISEYPLKDVKALVSGDTRSAAHA
jgi:hypothetical protein